MAKIQNLTFDGATARGYLAAVQTATGRAVSYFEAWYSYLKVTAETSADEVKAATAAIREEVGDDLDKAGKAALSTMLNRARKGLGLQAIRRPGAGRKVGKGKAGKEPTAAKGGLKLTADEEVLIMAYRNHDVATIRQVADKVASENAAARRQ